MGWYVFFMLKRVHSYSTKTDCVQARIDFTEIGLSMTSVFRMGKMGGGWIINPPGPTSFPPAGHSDELQPGLVIDYCNTVNTFRPIREGRPFANTSFDEPF